MMSILPVIQQLSVSLSHIGDGQWIDRLQRLHTVSTMPIRHFPSLVAYHQCLIFLHAHPESRELHTQVGEELSRISGLLGRAGEGGKANVLQTMKDEGLAWNEIEGTFSFDVLRWMQMRFPGKMEFSWCGSNELSLREVMKPLLPAVEAELIEKSGLSNRAWLKLASGKSGAAAMTWLMQTFESAKLNDSVRDALFDSLKLFIRIAVEESELSLTWNSIRKRNPFFHTTPLLRKPDLTHWWAGAKPKQIKLTADKQQQLLDSGIAALVALYRETEFLTWGEAGATELFDMGRGLEIALFEMKPMRRLTPESYIGYFAFRNGRPMAYGGSWILFDRATMGINILPPYRGGESAWVFAQIMRLYASRHRITRFAVEPYQFGKGNPEGLRSGAFWFYHRMGFRPVDAALAAIAKQESDWIRANPKHRTSVQVLKQLTGSWLWLDLKGKNRIPSGEGYEWQQLTQRLTAHITRVYAGDRKQALSHSQKRIIKITGVAFGRMSAEVKFHFSQLALLLDMIPDLESWSIADKKKLKTWLLAKGGKREAEFILHSQRFPRLQKAFEKLFDSSARSKPNDDGF